MSYEQTSAREKQLCLMFATTQLSSVQKQRHTSILWFNIGPVSLVEKFTTLHSNYI